MTQCHPPATRPHEAREISRRISRAARAAATLDAIRQVQQINHRGRLVAVVVAGHAIIDDTLTAPDRHHVQAMCLYALEIAARQRPGPYTDAAADAYARQVVAPRA